MSRKYSHQGYQNTDRNDHRSEHRPAPTRELTTDERIQRNSLRHAIDREAKEVIRCHACGRGTQSFDSIEFDTRCPSCTAPLHCCRSCRNFDSGARWQCRAEIATCVGDKNQSNDCVLYASLRVLDSTGRRSNTPGGAGGPREQFENLFKR